MTRALLSLGSNLGDPLGQCLDQVDRFSLDQRDDLGGELAVVDGVAYVVAGRGRGQVQLEDDVDHELLAGGPSELVDAVPPARP